jgi:hypothetical protein
MLPLEIRRLSTGSKTEKARARRRTMLRLNDEAPKFTIETAQGTIDPHEWIADAVSSHSLSV